MPEVIVLRGNSGSGKSSVAQALQQLSDPMAVIIEQDHFRQKMVAQKGREGRALAQRLMLNVVALVLSEGRDVIVEGIFRSKKWNKFFEELLILHPEDNHFFYFDVTFDETVRRHNTRLKRHEFDASDMAEWFMEGDYLEFVAETIIPQGHSLDESTREIAQRLNYL